MSLVMSFSYQTKANELFSRIWKRKEELDRTKKVHSMLKERILWKDLSGIYEWLLNNKSSLCRNLRLGKPIRKKRIVGGTPNRTLAIQWDPIKQEFELIIETKSKRKDGTKDPLTNKFAGTFKHGKDCYRVDTPAPLLYVSLVVDTQNVRYIREAELEAHVSQQLSEGSQKDPHFAYLVAGERYSKVQKGKFVQKVTLYGEKANLGSLQDCIKLQRIGTWSEAQKDAIALSLLESLKAMHDKQYYHQDIKPQNILIYQDSSGKLSARLSDLGKIWNAKTREGESRAVATVTYESPEIAMVAAHCPRYSYAPYFKDFYGDSWGKRAATIIMRRKLLSPIEQRILNSYIVPNPANDIWALGIVLHEIYFGEQPDSQSIINGHPLLKGMLAVNRSDRFTIDQALASLKQKIAKREKANIAARALEAVRRALEAVPASRAAEEAAAARKAREEAAARKATEEAPTKAQFKASSQRPSRVPRRRHGRDFCTRMMSKFVRSGSQTAEDNSSTFKVKRPKV